jgi:hypothetical protein
MRQIGRLLAATGRVDGLVFHTVANFRASLVNILFSVNINVAFPQNNHNYIYVSPMERFVRGAIIATIISDGPGVRLSRTGIACVGESYGGE